MPVYDLVLFIYLFFLLSAEKMQAELFNGMEFFSQLAQNYHTNFSHT